MTSVVRKLKSWLASGVRMLDDPNHTIVPVISATKAKGKSKSSVIDHTQNKTAYASVRAAIGTSFWLIPSLVVIKSSIVAATLAREI